jgi:Pvc16 N-terminal domain
MSEIRNTLEQVAKRLNEFIRNAAPRQDDWVILSNVVDQQGNPYEEAVDKIVMFLAGIQKEVTVSTYNPNVPVAGNSFAVVSPPLYIDLFILFYANFSGKNYREGLTAISRTITFFQQNLWFTPATLPGLDPRIDKLTFELTNLDPIDLNYILGLTGAKYLPSVYYKVRMIPFVSDAMQAQSPAVQGLQNPSDLSDQPTQETQP